MSLPITEIISVVESLAPKLSHLIPEEHKDEVNMILDRHKQDLIDKTANSPMTRLSTSWITILLTLLILIIFTAYLVTPLVNFFTPVKVIPLPDQLWTLILFIVPSIVVNKHLPGIIDKMGNKSKDE